MNITVLPWICCSSVISALPVLFVKQYINTNKMIWLCSAMIAYIILLYSYVKIMSVENDVSQVYPLINFVSIIVVIIIGLTIFSEKLTLNSKIGILFGITSIYFISKK